MTRLFLRSWYTQEVHFSAFEIRGRGAAKGFISGAAGGFSGQLISNTITALRGNEEVNWGVSLGLATGIAAFFGTLGGPVGATRMRHGEYYIEPEARVGQAGTYSVRKDNDYHVGNRTFQDMARETTGERWGSSIGAGLGLLGDISNTLITVKALPTDQAHKDPAQPSAP